VVAFAAAPVLVVAMAPAAGAWQDQQPSFQVVADNLNNPRQIAVRHNSVYVAEAGTGGENCPPPPPEGSEEGPPCIGLTGSVTRVRNGKAKRVQTGLPSLGAGEGEVVGVDALALRDGTLYGIMTGACDLAGAPPEIAALAGHVLRLDGGTSVTPVGDASSVECAGLADPTKDPDGLGVDTDPYGLAVKGRTFYVADAAGNTIVKIRNGTASLATVVAPGQTVPTSLAFGPDGALYIGTLNFEAGPGGANVYRYEPWSGDLTVYASGLSAITGLAWGDHGRLYVAEFTKGFGPTGPLPDGDVIEIPRGGGAKDASWRTLGVDAQGNSQLHFPGGVGVLDDGLYVSNWSIATGQDGAFGPGNHGQLVRIDLGQRGGHHHHDDQGDDTSDE
jgi:glucose/arabinose dehydrogenase